jgi:hypothetical protein
MKQIIFSEEQKFTQSWIAILLYVMIVFNITLFGYGFIKQIIYDEPWGNTTISDTGLIITFLLVLGIFSGLIILLHRAVLRTAISKEEIRYTFPPFFTRQRIIRANEIEHISVRKYNPVLEYGGWGIRYGSRKGKAYNVKGNMGIQLLLKNGKRILIGTQKKDQAEWAIRKLLISDTNKS